MMILVLFVKDFVNSIRVHMIWSISHGPYNMVPIVWPIRFGSYLGYYLAGE